MIERFYLEEYLSFKKVELNFKNGLVIFSGPSGAGKSVLFNSMVASFGQKESKAKLSEMSIVNTQIKNEDYLIDDDFVIKQITTTKTRHFLNNQTISKNDLQEFSKGFFKHLHLKDTSDFESENIVEFLDFLGGLKFEEYKEIHEQFQSIYKELKEIKHKLQKIYKDEQDIENLKEFTKFEIEKISKINPKVGEYEELKELKDTISKKDKIEKVLLEAKPFLDNTHKISLALSILEVESSFFDDAINEVHNQFEKFYDKILSFEDMNIEDTLDRIEELAGLQKKYGSIEEAIEYKKIKQKELDEYENITFEKAILEKNYKKYSLEIEKVGIKLTELRTKGIEILEADMNLFLRDLYLTNLGITLNSIELTKNGYDEVVFSLNNTELKKLSSGEFNRLRLALLTARSIYECDNNGILFLDEIDANLSGKESESIAKVLKTLSKNYQIFAISHQPQLSSTADQHFLVEKIGEVSQVKELNDEERIAEISRMISGENITEEATLFAKTLLTKN
ncbi:MAG: AAA family ATPase [Arcobacteraceae bacterium]|nr:AAA family ATPase [Arcobacteraceae bacterium]